MADNVEADAGTGGATFATDDIAGVHYPRSKVVWGADGVATDVSAADPLPVAAATLPLPTGAATAAKQDTGNTSLATLAGAVAGTEMQVDVLSMPSTPVTNAGLTALLGAIAGTEVQVDVLTMPTITVNTHAVTATDLDIRNLVNTDVVTAELSAVDNAVLDAIAASVASIDTDTSTLITSNAAIQVAVELLDNAAVVLGTATYTEATSTGLAVGAVRRDADTTLVNTTNEWGPLQMDANGRLKVEAFSGETLPVSLASTTVTGTVAVTQSGTWDEVGINDSGNSITVDWAGTAPPIGAGVEATALRVTLATDSTGVVSVDDNGGSLTVDGTVAVTGVATEATLASLLTSSQLIDDTIVVLGTTTYTEATSAGQAIGAVRRDADTTLVGTTNEWGPLQMDANGRLKVEAFSGEALPVTFTGSTDVATQTTLASLLTSNQLIDDTIFTAGTDTYTEATSKGALGLAVRRDADTTLASATNEMVPLQVDANGALKVEIFDGGASHTVDAPLATPVNVQIGNATLAAGVIDETGASAVDALAVGGGTAHDAVDSGNPIKIGGIARQANPTAVAALDRVAATFDDVGRQVFVVGQVRDLMVDQYTQIASSSAETTILTAAASTFHDMTQLVLTNATATAVSVTIRDVAAGSARMIINLAASGGAVIPFHRPVKQATVNTAWTAQLSSAAVTVDFYIQAEKNV